MGYTKTLGKEKFRIYANRGEEAWEIPNGRVRLSYGLTKLAPDWLCLAPMGVCILED